jgi:cytochrome d ubiquinol oxidase subunit II
VIDTIFSISSVLTPFALGAAIGAIATGRVPVGNISGHLFSSWLNPTSIFIGVVAVANCAYLAAVYLAADAARLGERPLEQAFRRRALGAGVVAGAVALGGIVVVNSDSHRLFHTLLTGDALAAVIVSFLAGVTTLALVWRRRFDTARFGAAVAVASIIAGWALARWPTILPGLTIDDAASGHDTLVWVIVSVSVGAAITFPSLGLLYGLTLRGRFQDAERPAVEGIARRATSGPRWAMRAAVSSFIAGIGLLTFADAAWAHAIGVLCLLGFIIVAFLAIVPSALADPAQNVPAEASGRFFPSRFRHPGDGGSGGLR